VDTELNIDAIKLELQSKDTNVLKKAINKIGNYGIHLLETEVLNIFLSIKNTPNEWELKSLIIMALGKLQCKSILPDIELIIKENLPKSAVTTSAASAYVRLKRENINDVQPIIELLKFGNIAVSYGALQVLWQDKTNPPLDKIDSIIKIIQYDRKSFFERHITVDPRQELLKAISVWSIKNNSMQNFVDYCSMIPSLQNEDAVRKYSINNSKLDKILYRIEIIFEEDETSKIEDKIILCINDLLKIVNPNACTAIQDIDYYRERIKTNDWYNIYILTNFVKELIDKGYSKDTIEKIIYTHFPL
jgi:hypothetical protein